MYLVLGLARTGLAVARFLAGKQLPFCVFDDDDLRLHKAKVAGYKIYSPEDFNHVKTIIISPGIPFAYPAPHPVLETFLARNDIEIVADTYLFQKFAPQAKYIGVTGTNGKSTTTALITHTLKQCGITAYMGGNIGIPVFDLPLTGDVYVFELSSFQLERSPAHKLDVACWINFSEDHLAQHGTIEAYFKAKQKIFDQASCKVFGVDDDFPEKYIGTDGIPLSIHSHPLKDLPHPFLKGDHNLQNMLITLETLKPLGLEEKQILDAMQSFQGLSHRQQVVCMKEGVVFINDSKATSAAATETALKAYDNIYWIVGGQPKSDGIAALSPYFSRIKKAFTFGEAAECFADVLRSKHVETQSFNNLEQIFAILPKLLQEEKVSEENPLHILFSPACASFDQYRDFEERGEHFIKLSRQICEDHSAPMLQKAGKK